MTQAQEKQTERAAHTPGPWTVDVWTYSDVRDGVKTTKLTIQNKKDAVAQCLPLYRGDDDSAAEEQANARLIAASPDLLQAAKYIRERWKSVPFLKQNGKSMAILDKAIAKAEGN